MHCVCINPNPMYLKKLIEAGGDIQIMDRDLRKPIHYAAACSGPEPLKLLLEKGANVFDIDN